MLDQISVSLDAVTYEQRLLADRLAELHRAEATPKAWRSLQYDARCALVHSQVRLAYECRGDTVVDEQARRHALALSICVLSLHGLLLEITEALTAASAN